MYQKFHRFIKEQFLIDEGNSFSFTWNSSSLSTQDEIFRPYNNAGLFADSSANLLGP